MLFSIQNMYGFMLIAATESPGGKAADIDRIPC
jgi:hypothetical protein